jgi:hypothetical protein
MASIRDTPVSRAISRINSFCRKCIRRMMFNRPMWITPSPPPLTARGKVHMAQFSVKIMRLTGSLLSENQHLATILSKLLDFWRSPRDIAQINSSG